MTLSIIFFELAEDLIDFLLGYFSLGETKISFFKPQLSIALATIPIFSGNWGLTNIIEGLLIVTIVILNHKITCK